jgi:hypothetical protein
VEQLEKPLLHQGVEPRAGLIQDDQLRLVQQRLHDAHLFTVAKGQIVNLLFQVEVQRGGKPPYPLRAVLFIEAGGVFEQFAHAHAVVVEDFAGQVAHALGDFRREPDRVFPEELCAA